MKHYFPNVPRLGNVAVSRHAQDNCLEHHITEEQFEDTLLNGKERPDGQNTVWMEKGGVRIVIIRKPTPFRGAALAVSTYRVLTQAKAHIPS